MSEIWEKGVGWKMMLVVCLAFAQGACSTTSEQSPPVVHVVLVWLKRPSSATDRAQIRRAALSLRMIPGVVRVQAGRDLPLPPTVEDRSFDFGVAITFRDRAALRRYEGDPQRAALMARYLRPLVRRYAIEDLGVR